MIYLTFVGNNDRPNPEGSGPALTVYFQYSDKITDIYILQTPKNEGGDYPAFATFTSRQITSFNPEVKVNILPVDIIDPTDYKHVYSSMLHEIQKIQEKNKTSSTIINLSSGTPTMTVCWVLIKNLGVLPNATLVQSVNPKFRHRNISTNEVDFDFVNIHASETPEMIQTELIKVHEDKRVLQAEKTVRDLNTSFPYLIGDSKAMRDIKEQIQHDISTDTHVLISGERGTGKEVVAKSIWDLHRKPLKQNYEIFNCAGFPENLIESELFGHEKGAFTDADKLKKGIFEIHDGHIIFLDEIGYMTPQCQSQLNRLLQEGTIRRVGGTESIKVDIQVIAATNVDIYNNEIFRQDLKDRFPEIIKLPPLRNRRSDISNLVQHFINSGAHPVSLDKNVIKKLEEYDWPGNVRELKNWVDRIARRFAKNHLEWNDIPERYIPSRLADESTEDDYSPELPFDIKKFEEMIRLSALEKAEGNASEADRLLNLKPGTMKAWRHKRKQKSKIS